MPERIVVRITLDRDTAARYAAESHRRRVPVHDLLVADLHDKATTYALPEPPPPPTRRSFRELREESRERHGGVGAYTQSLPIVRPDQPTRR